MGIFDVFLSTAVECEEKLYHIVSVHKKISDLIWKLPRTMEEVYTSCVTESVGDVCHSSRLIFKT